MVSRAAAPSNTGRRLRTLFVTTVASPARISAANMAFAVRARCWWMQGPCGPASCLQPRLTDSDVRTVEGYHNDPVMEVIRECFSECHALQCGFCTPGMLATAYDIITRLPNADRDRIREELSGNLCRCTGYLGIINAIELALRRVRNGAATGKPPAQGPNHG